MTTPRIDIGAEAILEADGVPEERLAASVLRMALEDLLEPQRLCSDVDPIDILQETRRFCFSSDPAWKRSREDWCDAAGIDVSYFQRLAAERCAASIR